eukprot:Blabericola_migrator_1__8216@NODE_4252_length_1257_cov_4_405882_g2630_i0_p1_GENE_NODE_4252_length_1257_cov_4_405882_g2630_i0NODE_4252_length_1257_cov_4_405882_g2630_i0_p1_ORF_typecomplete_len196_score19_80RT_RNaseH_2/PF17919_1/7_3e07RVT_1/PF00078_27/0_00019RT_RNaseH/PF17917_1/0_00094_NODE_4252_length_1257_cov_4_405882_g2630_i04311018
MSSVRATALVVLVKKKPGDIRFRLDFRQLNNYTVRDAYPLPRIADLMDAIQGSRYFVASWILADTHEQRRHSKDDVSEPRGLYEFTVMPFGLVNAYAAFQRMVDRLFGDFFHEGVLLYLNDILVHAATEEKLLQLPMAHPLDTDTHYVLPTDASDIAIAAALSREYPAGFYSRALTPTEDVGQPTNENAWPSLRR